RNLPRVRADVLDAGGDGHPRPAGRFRIRQRDRLAAEVVVARRPGDVERLAAVGLVDAVEEHDRLGQVHLDPDLRLVAFGRRLAAAAQTGAGQQVDAEGSFLQLDPHRVLILDALELLPHLAVARVIDFDAGNAGWPDIFELVAEQ